MLALYDFVSSEAFFPQSTIPSVQGYVHGSMPGQRHLDVKCQWRLPTKWDKLLMTFYFINFSLKWHKTYRDFEIVVQLPATIWSDR